MQSNLIKLKEGKKRKVRGGGGRLMQSDPII